MPRPVLVSACLLGLNTRYDGRAKGNPAVLRYLSHHQLQPVPVCPEQLAGLPTPRSRTFFAIGDGEAVLDGWGSVVSEAGEERNPVFLAGARETLKAARLCACDTAILKERSPSCGVRQIYLGETPVAGRGVSAALLARHGLALLSEEDMDIARDKENS